MSSSTKKAMLASLSGIVSLARDIQRPYSRPPCANRDAGTSSQTIHLREPESLDSLFLSLGTPANVAAKLSGVYIRHAHALQKRTQESFALACSHGLSAPAQAQLESSLSNLYVQRLQQWTRDMIAKVSKRLSQQPDSNSPLRTLNTTRKAFNQEFVPILEAVFKESPNPTRTDKQKLAQKSGMTARQIDIWFQNRRRRTKQADTVPRTKTIPESRPMSDQKITPLKPDPHIFTGAHLCSTPPSTIEQTLVGTNCCNPLDASITPFHAFPRPYPPQLHENKDHPFLCKTGPFVLPEITWTRRPSSTLRTYDIDASQLASDFATMRLGKNYRKRAREESPLRCNPMFRVAISSNEISSSRGKYLGSFPSPTSVNAPARRKFAPLPRRAPKGAPILTEQSQSDSEKEDLPRKRVRITSTVSVSSLPSLTRSSSISSLASSVSNSPNLPLISLPSNQGCSLDDLHVPSSLIFADGILSSPES